MQIANLRVGGFMGIENKFVDYEVAATIDNSWAGNEIEDGTALSLSAVAQGDGESNRDGRRMEMLSVHLKGFVTLNCVETNASPTDSEVVRLILVLDKQTNGAQLNAEDVVTVTTFDVNAWRNLQNSQRFRILKDHIINLQITTATQEAVNDYSSGGMKFPFEMHVVFKKPITVNHTGTTAVIASVADNSIHLIGVSTHATLVTINYNSRVRFRG